MSDEQQRFDYEVSACVLIDRAVVEYLMESSRRHYDAHCRSVGQPGGFLYGWHNRLSWMEADGKTSELVKATFRELDTLAKLAEVHSPHGNPKVYVAITKILGAINAEVSNLRKLGTPQWNQEPFSLVSEEMVECPTCKGQPVAGSIFVGWGLGWQPCSTCGGSMRVPAACAGSQGGYVAT